MWLLVVSGSESGSGSVQRVSVSMWMSRHSIAGNSNASLTSISSGSLWTTSFFSVFKLDREPRAKVAKWQLLW